MKSRPRLEANGYEIACILENFVLDDMQLVHYLLVHNMHPRAHTRAFIALGVLASVFML